MRVWSWWPGWKARKVVPRSVKGRGRPGLRQRLAAGGAVLALAGGMVSAGATVAAAGDGGRVSAGQAIAGGTAAGDGWRITGVTSSGAAFLGPLHDPTGSADWVWCINFGLALPAAPVTVERVQDPNAAAMSWLLQRLQYDPAALGVADRGLSNAAGSYLVHLHYEEGNKAGVSAEARRAALAAAAWPALTGEADRLWSLATANTNLSAATEVQTYTSGQRTGVISNIGIQNSRGEWIPGIDFTTTLTDGAVFAATGTRTFSGKTTTQPISLDWVATPGVHEVHANTEYPLSASTLQALRAGAGIQDSVRRAPDDPETLASAGVRFRAVGDFRPQGTSLAPAAVSVGEVLTDSFVPSAHPEDVWVELGSGPVPVTYAWQVFDVGTTPVPESSSAPSGEPVFSGTAVASAPGRELRVEAGVAPRSSTYVWVWSTSKALQPAATRDYVRDVAWNDGTKLEETTVVRWQVEHESITREFNVVPGGRVFDTIRISGMPEDHGQFVGLGRFEPDLPDAQVVVYGPVPALPTTVEVPQGTPVFWQDTVPAVNGVFDVGWDEDNPIVAPRQATYLDGDYFVFVYSFAGDARVEPFTSAFNDVAETWFIPANQDPVAGTWLITSADSEVVAGQPFGDTAYLTGTIHEGGYLAFDAYGPFVDGAEAVQSEQTLMWASEQIAVRAPGVFRSGSTIATLPQDAEFGDVYWVATYYDRDGNVVVAGEFGDPSEITRVTQPLRTGLVTEAVVLTAESGARTTIPVAGDSTYDIIRTEEGARFAPGSTVVSRLYFAPGTDQLICSPDQLVFTSQTVELTDAREYETDVYVTPVRQGGRHGWVETGYGPDGTPFGVGVCGEPAETFDMLSVRTTIGHEDTNGDGLAGAGDELWDDIHLEGRVPDGAEVRLESTVYEVAADHVTWGEAAINTGAGNITVEAGVCTADAVFTTLTVPDVVTEAGVYSTNRFTVPSAGERVVGGLTMVETATITRGEETRTVTGVCGDPDESIGPVYFGSGGGAAAAAGGASSLAVTGLSRMGLLLAAAALLAAAGGSLARWAEQRKRRLDPATA